MPDAADKKQQIVNDSIQKDIVKEALQEWLDKKFAAFGKWSATSMLAAAFVGLVYLWLRGHGWQQTGP
jgi:hypothetical protein